jgi:cysteinyl-tRNA synthetase
MAIKLYDSLTRSLKELSPSHADGVFRFYNCGPTVYASAHIGNFRTFIVNDVIRRLLELELGKDKVKHVRNLTDVDDKTIKRSREEGRSLADVTKQWTEKFWADCKAINCLDPHEQPTATGHIKEQVNMIEVLMEKGNAYRGADGSVYFKIDSYPEYGALSRIKERELKITDDSADSDHKDSVSDFALWKAYKPEGDGEVKWPSPQGVGEGRPGWHIECSAMIKKHLGDTIDLHTGGVDLLFPHHENEIAQSQCCNGTTMANHWYHGEHLLVNGKKMSKSDGTFYTVDDILAKGYSPAALRYALLAGHPRKQLNFTLDSLHAAESALNRLWHHIERLLSEVKIPAASWSEFVTPCHVDTLRKGEFADVINFLHDDLNTPGAIGALFLKLSSIATGGEISEQKLARIRELGSIIFAFGFDLTEEEKAEATIPDNITALAEKRWAAKQAKDWSAADALRAELTEAGWSMLDRKDSYSLEPLKK